MEKQNHAEREATSQSAAQLIWFYRTFGKLGTIYISIPMIMSFMVAYIIADMSEMDIRLRNRNFILTTIIAFIPMQIIVFAFRVIKYRGR